MIPAGEEFLVYWGETAFYAQLNADFNSSREGRETSNKQSGKFATSKGQRISSTLSLNALLDETATTDIEDIWNDYKDDEHRELKLSQEKVGGFEVVGTARISSIGVTAPDQENTETPIEFTFTGDHDIEKIDE